MLRSGRGSRAVLLSAKDARATRPRPWASVVELSADQLVAWGVLYYAYSVLSAPIARDLQVSTRFVAGAFSCTLLVSSLLARGVGRVLDRGGARPVLLAGAALAPIAFGALAAVRHELALLAVFATLGLAQATSLYEPAFRAVVDWFPGDPERSRALLVLTSIAGFASTAFLPVTAFLVHHLGWRAAVVVLASVLAAVTIPVRLAMPRRTHRITARHLPLPITADRPPAAATVLGAAFALHSVASTGATVCLVWHLVERGAALQVAATLAGLAGAAQVPGRLLLGPLQRVVRADMRLPLLFVVQAGALAAMAVASGPALALGVFVFGAANGMTTLDRASVVLEWFGQSSFGARSGQIASFALLARAAAPVSVEALHDTTPYAGVFALLAVALVLAGVLALAASRVRCAAAC